MFYVLVKYRYINTQEQNFELTEQMENKIHVLANVRFVNNYEEKS